MANVLPREQQIEVLHHLIEGNTLRSTTRLTGVHRTTIMNLMLRFGLACKEFLDRELRGLTLEHVEVDEIWTFVQKKQARLTIEERETSGTIGDMYVWTCLDRETKLIPCFVVSKRSADAARRLMTDLASRLHRPRPHQSDDHAFAEGRYRPVVQISSDAFAAYPEAVDLAFGPYCRYGQLIKNYRNTQMPGRYSPGEMIAAERRGVINMGESDLHTICTSHVERHNLTIRTLMKRFTRLALGFSKKYENLVAAVSMFMAYYNFVWRTRYPDDSGRCGRLRPPAAMMAGVTDHLWNFEELYRTVM